MDQDHSGQPMDDQEVDALSELSAESESFDDDLPSSGLLSFYDRLRDRVSDYVEKKSGRLGPQAVDFFLLIPDVFVLLLRLALDRDVPKEQRALIGGALAYFVLPVDLLPEAFVGPAGYADDLVLAAAMLTQAFGRDLEPFAEKYWSGSGTLRRALSDALTAGQGLLNTDIYAKIKSMLAEKGVDLDDADIESSHGDKAVN